MRPSDESATHGLISVIVPFRNAEPYLARCVGSLLKQTCSELEILLVDDGSTDGSGALCEAFRLQDARCRVVRRPHGGVSAARNAGLELAAGEYIAFVDADDYVHPQYLERLRDTLRTTGCDLAAAGFEKVSDRAEPHFGPVGTADSVRLLSQTELMAALFDSTAFMVVWGKLYRRRLLRGIRFAEESRIAEDVEFNAQAYRNVAQAALSGAVLYRWVERPLSATRSPFSERNVEAPEVYFRALEHLPKSDRRYRAFALQRLYKVLLYTRYHAPESFREAVRSKSVPLVRRTLPELAANRCIPVFRKLSLLALWYLPFLYRLFRRRMERRARLSKASR